MSKQQHIAFRTDASGEIGTGHFMRCLTLADALRKTGADIRFVCRELPAHLAGMLAEKDIAHTALTGTSLVPPSGSNPHAHWLWTGQEHDAQASLQCLEGTPWDWLIVDHYALDERWERTMRGIARQIMVIDDLADRKHDCDLLLDQNYYTDKDKRYLGKVPEKCRLLLGPRYALLRDEFRILRGNLKTRTGEVKRILVFFGGIDATNYTCQAITALTHLRLKDVQVDVVIGAQHPHRNEIERAC
jgi:UDP-2,4-diacetamido-2,4,6-trideoxy-beta-L-altropyranose hydrolase